MAELVRDFKLIEKNRFNAQHVRELIIKWCDGVMWIERLDHGVGFLKSRGSLPFDFNANT